MARELVTGVLDMQLTKLEVNGLNKLPIYGEIKVMRKNIDRLVETEMGVVIALLAEAQNLPESKREQQYDLVRAKTRDIVVRLSIERQRLMKRLKLADMAAQVRRQIEMQTANLRRTETLTVEKSAQAVATIQDQRDLKALYGQLVQVVRDVSTWGGPEGAAAVDGLRILRAGQVSEELVKSVVSLEATKFSEAAVNEKAVLKGLSALLEKVEEARGLADHDIEALLKEVALLTKRQEEVKDKTKREDLNSKAGEVLHKQQEQLHKDLDRLNDGLARIPGAEALLRQAKASAYEATASMFEAKRTEAVQEQDKALTNLKAITEQLKKVTDQTNAAKSADELARQLEHLKNAREILKTAEPHQEAAFDKNAKDADAKKNLAELGKQLDKARVEPELPSAVASRLNEAKEAVERAKDKLADPEARKEAKETVERATAEVHAAIADTERQQLAVKIGELGRAAEALERTAAHQRELADKAADAAKKGGFTPAEAKELHEEQKEAVQVAAKTAEGVKETAPKAAEKLNDAAAPLKKVDRRTGRREADREIDGGGGPGSAQSREEPGRSGRPDPQGHRRHCPGFGKGRRQATRPDRRSGEGSREGAGRHSAVRRREDGGSRSRPEADRTSPGRATAGQRSGEGRESPRTRQEDWRDARTAETSRQGRRRAEGRQDGPRRRSNRRTAEDGRRRRRTGQDGEGQDRRGA